MTLLISDEEANEVLTVEDFLETVEDAYRQYGMGLAGKDGFSYGHLPPPKREIRIQGKDSPHGAPHNTAVTQGIAFLEQTGMVVLQHSFRFAERRGGMFHLIDSQSGETLAIVMNNSGLISRMRTAADGAIAAKYMSREDSAIAGIIGTGQQGKLQLQMLAKVRSIEKAFAHSGRRRDDEYALEMTKKLGIDVLGADNTAEVVRASDVLVTVTRSTTPIVRGEWVGKGLHITSMGADCPLKMELDASTFRKADKIVIDCEQALDVAHIRTAMEQGILKPDDIYGNIGEVVAQKKRGRENESEITIYASTGMTLAYAAICARIYKRALRQGLGKEMESLL
jgi:ornithine cyclodeaminase/alanine dehydrogenase-like protein (mu-crystallin family)